MTASRRYAEDTKISIPETKLHIERLVSERYQATGFGIGQSGNRAQICFEMQDRFVRVTMIVPDSPQEAKARWRAILMIIKAKLESIETGIATFEQAFMADLVMPGGQTLGEMVIPHVAQAYLTGETPKLLPDYTEKGASS